VFLHKQNTNMWATCTLHWSQQQSAKPVSYIMKTRLFVWTLQNVTYTQALSSCSTQADHISICLNTARNTRQYSSNISVQKQRLISQANMKYGHIELGGAQALFDLSKQAFLFIYSFANTIRFPITGPTTNTARLSPRY